METLSYDTKNKLLSWCKLTLDEYITNENFEDAAILYSLIKAIEENNDEDIEKYFYIYTK